MIIEKPSAADKPRQSWQQQLANAFTDTAMLCEYLQIPRHEVPISKAAEASFTMRVPLSFAARMEQGNPHDPLLRQVLPIADEMLTIPGYCNDPVGDLEAVAETGLLQKYYGRVLLINTATCAINCRYCFRRNFPYNGNFLSRHKEQAALRFINEHKEISEVILSGGDPLLINDQHLSELIDQLADITHVRRIRIHSRIPIVLPDRITDKLLDILAQASKKIIIVLHSNHGNEIDAEVKSSCIALQQSNMTLLNQAVLLKGINDSAEVLCKLSEKLFDAGILPYYLHLLDKANGTGHFDVPESTASNIMQAVQKKLPGYLVPKLVREQSGALYKQSVAI